MCLMQAVSPDSPVTVVSQAPPGAGSAASGSGGLSVLSVPGGPDGLVPRLSDGNVGVMAWTSCWNSGL